MTPLHLRSVLSKLMRCTEKNGYTCSRHLILLHDNAWPCCTTNSSKVERAGLCSSTSYSIFSWPLANWLPLLQASRQLFAGKTLPQPAGCRKCYSKNCWILKHRFLCYRNKQAYFSLAKYVLIVTVPVLINKDVSSFNDLKFTVQNRNYVCINLLLNHNSTLSTIFLPPCVCMCVCACVCVFFVCQLSTHGYIYTVILCN